MKRRTIVAALAGLGLLVGTTLLLSWFLYRARVGNLQPPFVNAVGAAITAVATLVLAVLTAWYANSTRRLLETSQAQVSVMRASYAPVIDVEVDPASDHLQLSVTNRGEGTATNVTLHITIEAGTRVFRYIGYISRPIRPGEHVSGTSPRAEVTLGSMNRDEGLLNVVPVFQFDSETLPLSDLLDQLADDHDIANLQFRVACNDVIGEKEYSFTPLENRALSANADSIEGAWNRAATAGTITVTAPPPESLREYISSAVGKGRQLFGQSDGEAEKRTSSYEENIEPSIQ